MEKAYSQIRVFISSTFLDMQKEREILNQDVFPVVKGVCDRLGVAFNMIDLRWGITKEEQLQGNVLEICLNEIEHCKPYFIGLIGNRYGTILEEYNPDIEEKYQFIKENKDKSVTEMEMILGALSEENRERCFFYYKDPALFDASHNDGHDDAIENLKERIESLAIYHSDYADYGSFKDAVQRDLIAAIEADYPEGTDVAELRQEAYIRLHESNYIAREAWEEEAAAAIAYAQETHMAIAAVTAFPSGKTSTFNHLINQIEDADKIIINFEADVHMRYFPWHYLFRMIVDGLYACGYEFPDFEEFPEPEYLNNYESYTGSLLTQLKKWLQTIECKRPLYILINDAHLFFSKDRSEAFQGTFLFDTTPLPDQLHVIITTNDYPEFDFSCYALEPKFATEDERDFMVRYLAKFGKRIDPELLQEATPELSFYELKMAADYLILYCNFSSYQETARELLTKRNYLEILQYIYDRFIDEMEAKCKSVFTEILLRLYYYEPGLPERDLFASYDKETALERTEYQVFVELNEIEKAEIMRALRYFSNTESGVVFISDSYVRNFIGAKKEHLIGVLARNNAERTRKAVEDFCSQFPVVDQIIDNNQVFSKEDYLDKVSSGLGSPRILTYAILDPLCIALDAMISSYTQELKADKDAFDMEGITDHEIQILVTVQEAAELYKRNTRANLYAKLLRNVDLMLFVCSKSKTLLRRLISGYIDLNVNQIKPHSEIGKKMVAFAVDSEIKNILAANREEYPELLIDEVVANTILVLEEYDLMFDNFLDIGKCERRTFATKDYAVNACSKEARLRAYKIQAACEYGEIKEMEELIPQLVEYYQNTSNGYDKLLYAYYLFVAVSRLVANDMLTAEILEEYVLEYIGEIDQLRQLCFCPEITEGIDTFLSWIKAGRES